MSKQVREIEFAQIESLMKECEPEWIEDEDNLRFAGHYGLSNANRILGTMTTERLIVFVLIVGTMLAMYLVSR